jgi:hypothetical protein
MKKVCICILRNILLLVALCACSKNAALIEPDVKEPIVAQTMTAKPLAE